MEIKTNKSVSGKLLRGKVVSNKMKDTLVVAVHRFIKHKKYKKYFNVTKKYKVHDESNSRQVGDQVEIAECRPISKDKHFKIIESGKIKDENYN